MKTNEQLLDTLNPQKKALFLEFLKRVQESGWNIIITQSYRTIKEQNELHTLNNSNAMGGYSAHNYGFAIDCNFEKGRLSLKKATDKGIWICSGIPQIAEECGLRWGGSFGNYYDPIHFDCVFNGETKRWNNYLIKTYGKDYDTIESNKINWLFTKNT